MSDISRRELIRSGLLAGSAALLAPSLVLARQEPAAPAVRAGALRFAHLTDMHVQPELRAGDGYGAALRSLHKLDPVPQFIITGGDHVMDVFDKDAARSRIVWDLYRNILADNWDRRAYPTIGNHDVWAWGKDQQNIDPTTIGYGKAMACERFEMAKPYHSFDAGGWHFVCLDNIARRNFGYFGSLDEEQADWFKRDLESAGGKPVVVTTHIPLVAACVLLQEKRFDEKTNGYRVSDGIMHANVLPLVDLMRRHNVKLCLSGHMHMIDRVEFRGISFICDGAVSGNWWKGPHLEFPEGYGVIDLQPDGTFDHQYITYGWVAEKQ
jgi:3',5'-cyclic AMP phosphodiesterase CpdA